MDNSDKSTTYRNGGLFRKFDVARRDGKPENPKAEYFVLNVAEDPHARVAMDFYARSVAEENAKLGAEILGGLDRVEAGGKFYQES